MPWNTMRCFSLVALLMLSLGCQWKGIEVAVSNQSGSDIKDVTLTFTGGTETLPVVRDGSTESVVIEPTGDSNLTIDFVDGAGNTVSEPIDLYVEQGYRGKIEITVQPSNEIAVVDDIDLY